MDVATLYAGITTFTTGAMIAIFLTVFYSDNLKMTLLRKNQHARTIYYIILSDLVIIVGSGMFVNTTITAAQAVRLGALITMCVFTLNLVKMVLRLVNLLLLSKN